MGSTEDGRQGQYWATEPIAITGLSCKLAGDASDTESLWTMLAEGRDAWSEIPVSRFNNKGAYHADPDRLGTVSSFLRFSVMKAATWLTKGIPRRRRMLKEGISSRKTSQSLMLRSLIFQEKLQQ